MKILDTFTAKIYVGSKEGYDGRIHFYEEAQLILQEYAHKNPICVTLTAIDFIYKDGNEPGFEIGLINYPRFLDTEENIKNKAIDIANIFMNKFNQLRISVVCSDKTYMLENGE